MADEKGVAELMLELEQIGLKIADPETNQKVLEAMAEPVVQESKREAGRIFGKYQKTGKLAESIGSEWSPENPKEIKIGWGADGYYGGFHERGFFHKQAKRFVKNPHIRPAFERKKEEAAKAGIQKYKDILK